MDEKLEAYQDVQDVVSEYGFPIKLLTNDESTTRRDKYGSIINRGIDGILLSAFPIRNNPSVKLLESLGIREKSDCLFYFSMKTLEEKGLTEASVDVIRQSVEWQGTTYKLTSKTVYSQFNELALYLILGGVRT